MPCSSAGFTSLSPGLLTPPPLRPLPTKKNKRLFRAVQDENNSKPHLPRRPSPLLTTNASASRMKPLPPSPTTAFPIKAEITSHCTAVDGRLKAEAFTCTQKTNGQEACRNKEGGSEEGSVWARVWKKVKGWVVLSGPPPPPPQNAQSDPPHLFF